jgi:hypothetical protein
VEQSQVDSFPEDVSLHRVQHLGTRVEGIGTAGGDVEFRIQRKDLET